MINKYIGIPWNPKGRVVEDGLDCWGLVREWYKNEMDVMLPSFSNISAEELGYKDCSTVIMTNELRDRFIRIEDGGAELGDILVFNISGMPIHVAVALEGGKMLHANKAAGGVVVESYKQLTWEKRLEGVYRWKF